MMMSSYGREARNDPSNMRNIYPYLEGNISTMHDFAVFFSLLECKKSNSRSHGKFKNGNDKRKICTEKRINTSIFP